MPVIPVVFNKDAYLIKGDLSDVSSTYYDTRNFAKADLKDYKKYIPEEERAKNEAAKQK